MLTNLLLCQIGSESGKDFGQILNGNHATCPESIISVWKYWSDEEKIWKKDPSLTVECKDETDEQVIEYHDDQFNEYNDYFYAFDYSGFSTDWFNNLKNKDK